MKRRDALKTATLVLGYSISAGTVAAVMNSCKVDNSPEWIPLFLTQEQILLLEEVSEMIIPKTDTPGAKEAHVVRFIDATLACDKEALRLSFLEELASFDNMAETKFQMPFIKCDDEQKKAILDQMIIDSKSQTNWRAHIFNKIKERTVVGYCKSELGATKFLKYDPIPGGNYQGCIDYADVGRTWAL